MRMILTIGNDKRWVAVGQDGDGYWVNAYTADPAGGNAREVEIGCYRTVRIAERVAKQAHDFLFGGE